MRYRIDLKEGNVLNVNNVADIDINSDSGIVILYSDIDEIIAIVPLFNMASISKLQEA